MARSTVTTGDARTHKKYSVALLHATSQGSFMMRNFSSTDGTRPIHRITDLEKGAGDQVSVDIYHRLNSLGVEGDATLKGSGERLTAATQNILIDQIAKEVDCGGRMARKRTSHNHREIALYKLKEWGTRWYDEQLFMQLTGSRGAETGDWLHPVGYTARAGNTFALNSVARSVFPEGISTEVGITGTYTMKISFLEKIMDTIKTMANPPKPVTIEGEDLYPLILSPTSVKDLRTATGANDWMQLKKYRLPGEQAPWKDVLGVWGNLILYSHNKIIKTNTGASSVAVSHNLLLGAQSGFVVHGNASGDGMQWDWHEEMDDRGRVPVVDVTTIVGIQKALLKLSENASAASAFGVLDCMCYAGASVS